MGRIEGREERAEREEEESTAEAVEGEDRIDSPAKALDREENSMLRLCLFPHHE